ncbi:MAG: bacterioferritin [Anaerolineales bacterium]|nr:bacterioferritin [Anaerolineales bacterium]
MKGDAKLIKVLNELLADELTAISQYMVHSEMCAHWGYQELHEAKEKQAKDEMYHAEWLLERILFLEGTPIVSKLNPMVIGATVPELVTNDMQAELGAVKAYNSGIALAGEMKDESTADSLVEILKMEEGHVDWAEKQLVLIEQLGLENYLALQTGGGE